MEEARRGVHREERVPGAVKALTGPMKALPGAKAWEEASVAALHREVQAIARLRHPAIVQVLHFGALHEAATARSDARLVAGTTFLVMEHASGSTLGANSEPLVWPALRDLLLRVLDALAHARARQVIHRNLEPDNVLLCTEADLRPGLKVMGLRHRPRPAEGAPGRLHRGAQRHAGLHGA